MSSYNQSSTVSQLILHHPSIYLFIYFVIKKLQMLTMPDTISRKLQSDKMRVMCKMIQKSKMFERLGLILPLLRTGAKFSPSGDIRTRVLKLFLLFSSIPLPFFLDLPFSSSCYCFSSIRVTR